MKKRKHRWWIPVTALILVPVLVFALVCACRINRHVWDYPYDPELPKPGPSVDFQYDDVFGDLYIRWCNLLDNSMTAAWKAPEGVVKSTRTLPCGTAPIFRFSCWNRRAVKTRSCPPCSAATAGLFSSP